VLTGETLKYNFLILSPPEHRGEAGGKKKGGKKSAFQTQVYNLPWDIKKVHA